MEVVGTVVVAVEVAGTVVVAVEVVETVVAVEVAGTVVVVAAEVVEIVVVETVVVVVVVELGTDWLGWEYVVDLAHVDLQPVEEEDDKLVVQEWSPGLVR